MKINHWIIIFLLLTTSITSFSQGLTGYRFNVVNMIPNAQSNETTFDSETNIAVDPSNTSNIIGSAFTRNPTSTATAPIYVSSDGGNTWALNNIVPSGNGMTGDITLAYGSTGGTLYSGILRGGSGLRIMMLRSANPGGAATMTTLADRNAIQGDQPYVNATTVDDAGGNARDRIFSGDNLFGNRLALGGTGRTAEVMVSNDARATTFAGFNNIIVEARNTAQQDMPATRTAIHDSGVVYAIFYSWQSGASSPFSCDVVVVRDDNFATGTAPFTALADATDSQAGQRVVTGRAVPAFGVSLGNNRLVASNLSIAVDPNNAATVYIAWCDRVGTNDYTLHIRRSTDSGQNWGTSDLLTITNATNPAIAITNSGRVGIMYQQLIGTGSATTWQTHFRSAPLAGSLFTDDILSTFLDSDLSSSSISPSLGDYLDMQAVGNTFYGVFPASNRPVMANFPKSVTYQRNANFTTNQLRNATNSANVSVSVDPFFFRISPRFIINLCDRFPDLCLAILDPPILRLPPYPCLTCPPEICLRCPPWPCLSCPPFEFPFEEIYKLTFKDSRPQTILEIPYFHLYLDGFNPEEYNIRLASEDGVKIKQRLSKTKMGYVLSFKTSSRHFNPKEGLKDLKLLMVPMSEEAAKKKAEFSFRLEVSDYQFKEHMAHRNMK